MSPPRTRSSSRRDMRSRTVFSALSTPCPASNGRWNSTACAAQRISTARTISSSSMLRRTFLAAAIPMETWSSWEAQVGTESELAGVARTRISDRASAATTWAIMKPERSPGSGVRKAGRPERSGLRSRSIRRSEIEARSAAAMATRSRLCATICAWKLPPLRTRPPGGSAPTSPSVPPSTRTSGLSVVEFASVARMRLAYPYASRAAPWTCGIQRSE